MRCVELNTAENEKNFIAVLTEELISVILKEESEETISCVDT